ncbi:hypothetical protein ASG31_09805 [Chryseobacterium sp. Leaf404]|uniref:hypothetical protein n=1 Tax=unclassified Chryseobacterium TaxID=2593645 RepID=UPI0007022029|nr:MULTISPECIES: hypothetical protein [unclassified Chryseobacterium]KQT17675.1 hypothetical protein ASG31_09805 [Chryseobacterium sp. Leaf404]
MTLAKLKNDISTILRNTTKAEILAGKLEKEIIPYFLKQLDYENGPISDVLIGYIEKVSVDKYVIECTNVQSIKSEYLEAKKNLAKNEYDHNLIIQFSESFKHRFFYDYRNDQLLSNKNFTESITNINQNFENICDNSFSSDNLQKICTDKKLELTSIQNVLKQVLVEIKQKLLLECQNIKAESGHVKTLKIEEEALIFFYRIFLNQDLTFIGLGYEDNFKLKTQLKTSNSELLDHISDEKLFIRNWREILSEILNKKIPNFSGEITDRFDQNSIKLSSTDRSYFLALKSALSSNYEIITEENEITLSISGGMMTKISFSDKGRFLDGIQKKDVEIYYKKNRYENEKLFTNIYIKYPHQWFFLTSSYLIEITFEAAPILFGNIPAAALAENILISIKEEEEEEERSQTEERLNSESEKTYDKKRWIY